jgi:predicted RNase H-like nuclease (RuvC/YqgF family)
LTDEQIADAAVLEEAEIASERLENGNRPKRSAVQKRMDKLTRDKHGLRQENQELRDVLQRYEATIRRYKQALMEAKKNARR